MRLVLFTALLSLCPQLIAAQRLTDGTLAVTTIGAGTQTFVLVHGGPGFRADYLRPEWDQLTAYGRVIYYDQRGCGRSTMVGPFGWPQHVQDLAALLDELSAGNPVTLIGSSWGAYLALLFTFRHPDRVRQLILTGLPPWPRGAGILAALTPGAAPPPMTRGDSLASLPLLSSRRTDSAAVAHIAEPSELAKRLGPNCEDAATGAMHSLLQVPPIDSLKAIVVPVLLLASTDKPKQGDGSGAMAAILPNAIRVAIPAGGHDPWFTQPDSTFAVVRHFLDSPR